MSAMTRNADQWVDDFKQHFTGKLSEDVVKRTVESIEKTTKTERKADTSYSASGSIASLMLYMQVQCIIKGGKTFNGHTYLSAGTPGGGALFGDVYLASGTTLEDLYKKTVSFLLTATPVYTAFYFYDAEHDLLAHFQAGAVSTILGEGSGPGSWS